MTGDLSMQVKLTVNDFWRPLRMANAAKSMFALLCRIPSPQLMSLGAAITFTQTSGRGHDRHPSSLHNEGVFLVCIDGHITQLVQELAHEKSEVCLERRSFADAFKLALQSDCVEDTSCHVPLCQAKVCVCARFHK